MDSVAVVGGEFVDAGGDRAELPQRAETAFEYATGQVESS